MPKTQNEVRKCGCTVIQQTIGRTKWNRLQLCADHQERPHALFPLSSLSDLTLDGLRTLKMRVEQEIEEQEREELEEEEKAI